MIDVDRATCFTFPTLTVEWRGPESPPRGTWVVRRGPYYLTRAGEWVMLPFLDASLPESSWNFSREDAYRLAEIISLGRNE